MRTATMIEWALEIHLFDLKLNGFLHENPSQHELNYDCSKRRMKPTTDVRELLPKKLQVGDGPERN